MGYLFVGISAAVARQRSSVSGETNVGDEDVKDPGKLAEILRSLAKRMAQTETLLPPEGVEFEVEVGTAGTVTTLQHNLRSHVRFSVVFWTKVRAGTTYPTAAPVLVADELSTSTVLHLRSYVAGRAIVRVEPANAGITYNF